MVASSLVKRTPWRENFPDTLIHTDESSVKQHPQYLAAKSGNPTAAANLINDLLSEAIIEKLTEWSVFDPILVSVHAEEALGKNAIPEVMANFIAKKLKWDVESNVVQANIVNHTGANGFVRLARQAVFEGALDAERCYVIVDDFIGQGGTIANLRGHIEAQGGLVVGTTVLTGKNFSAKLAISPQQLVDLRNKHEQLEQWWTTQFGFEFNCLTQSEARYLERSPDADTIRDRITALTQT